MPDPRLDNPGGPDESGPFQDPDATEPSEPLEPGDPIPDAEFDPGVQ